MKNNPAGLKKEGIRVYTAFEPLSFRRRSFHEVARFEDTYEWEHSEEFVKGLKERGFNLLVTTFSKGHGITAEAEERENTRKMVRLCHEHGIYAGGYIRYSTFIPETFKLDDPGCVERMAAVGTKGPTHYFDQYWRYVPCPSSKDYLDYLDKLIGIGVGDIGLDCLHVDGMDLLYEPYACHCPKCLAGFRSWLKERYPTPQAQKERLGFAPVDHVEIPEVISVQELVTMRGPVIADPVAQEWMFFRCHLLARIWKFIVNAAHSRNPDCYVQGNVSFCPNVNPFWVGAKDMSLIETAGNEGFFTEEGMPPDYFPDGRLHGHFETFKKLRRLGFQTFTYSIETEEEKLKRTVAHQLAFNLDIAGVFSTGGRPAKDKWALTVPEYMAFHRDRRDLFGGTVQAHDVAVYYSERNCALNSGTPLAAQSLARDVMMLGHIPFGYLMSGHRKEMGEFRAMVLPEVESIGDAEAEDIAAYVRAGGGLLVLGANTGRYDECRRLRRQNAFASGLGVGWDESSSAFSARVGKGRVAFLPQLRSPEGSPEELVQADLAANKGNYLILYTEKWRMPVNAAEMLQLLEWAAGGYRFGVLVPNAVAVEFVWQPDEKRHLIHLVNHDLARDVGPFEIQCHFPVRSACAFTPDGEPPKASLNEASGVIQIDGFHRYLIVAVS